jgi:hypothetical protein
MSIKLPVYNLKINPNAAARLREKADAKGIDLADYLRNLIAFGETIDDMTNEDSQIILHKSKIDKDKDITIPVRALKHG